MRRCVFLPPVFVLALAMLAGSCMTVPDSGRRTISLVGPQKEKAMGLDAFQKYKASKPISRNPEYNRMLRNVAVRMTKVIDMPNAEWEFIVFEDPEPNAFALPGGKVGVHSGMFQITKDEAGLAAVVGHEIAHVIARHGGERMSTQMLAALGGVATAAVLNKDKASKKKKALILGAYGAGAGGTVLHFSRKQETEADQLGALYMARSGYDPRASVDLWMRFAEYKVANNQGRVPQFLSTHPSDANRIRDLQAFMPRAMEEYRRHSVTRTRPVASL